MRLSRKATKFLRYLSQNKEYRYYYQLEKDYKKFDDQHSRAIMHYGMLDIYPDTELPSDPDERHQAVVGNIQFRINDAGYAYLDSVAERSWNEIRSWIAILISLAALIISIFTH